MKKKQQPRGEAETHGYGTQFTLDEMGFMQLAAAKILAAVARGELDLNAVAQAELALRGLDAKGQWIGFQQAEDERQARRAVPEGERRLIEEVIDALQAALPLATQLRRTTAKEAEEALAVEAAVERAARTVKRLQAPSAGL